MANWSDPRSGPQSGQQFGGAPFGSAASVAASGARDQGLRAHMLSVYNMMASGVLLTAIVALGFAASGMAAQVFTAGGPLKFIVMFAPLGFVFGMSFGAFRMATSTLHLLFWGYAATMGLSLSTVFLAYDSLAVAQAFAATAAGFAGLSLYGYATKRDLSPIGSFLIMGVVGLIVAMVINMFVHSGPLGMAISAIGVLLFAGLTAYDTQRTKSLYFQVAGTGNEGRVVVMSALNLYLDFINMFLFVLRLFGNGRN